MRVISSPQPTPDARIDITLFALTTLFLNVNVMCESNLTAVSHIAPAGRRCIPNALPTSIFSLTI